MPRLPSSISSSLLTCDFFKSQILASQFPVTSPSRNLSLHRLHSWGLSSLRLSPIGQSTTSRNVIISRDSRGASFLQHAQSVRRRRYPPSPPAPLQPPLAPVLPSASPRGQDAPSSTEPPTFKTGFSLANIDSRTIDSKNEKCLSLWHDLRPAHVVYQIPECAPINVPATTTTRSSKNVNQTTGFPTEVTSRSGVHQTPDRLTTSQPNHWVESQSSHSLKPPSSRTMKESFMVIDLPLKQHPELGKIYDGCDAGIRIGKLLEDIDAFAAMVAYKHCLPTDASPEYAKQIGLCLVTAAVDHIEIIRPLHRHQPENIRLSGHVLQTTTSMVEMLIKVTTSSDLDQSYLVPEDQIKPETILIARVVMVARNSKTGGKWTVPRLLPALDDPSEQSLTGILNQIRLPRLMSSSKSTSPTQSKSPLSLVRERFTIYAGPSNDRLPLKAICSADTRLTHSALCHPQDRVCRIHHHQLWGRVFTNENLASFPSTDPSTFTSVYRTFMVKRLEDNAFCTSTLFAKKPVELLSLDEFQFRRPIEIGMLVQLTSEITRVNENGGTTFQVYVEIKATDMISGESNLSNLAHFTFRLAQPDSIMSSESKEGDSHQKSLMKLDEFVMPQTDAEAQRWLEAEERASNNREIRQIILQAPSLV